jgi:hypothetical protein
MIWVKFESIYTEIDRYGNQRKWEKRFETKGEAHEVSWFLRNTTEFLEIPGTTRVQIPEDLRKLLNE